MQEIEENGFNLNIPRYVDTFEPEPASISLISDCSLRISAATSFKSISGSGSKVST